MTETDKKKAYLNRYRKSRTLESQCREELAQLYIDIRVPSVKQSDGMPHAHGNNTDLSDSMASIERYENNLRRQIEASERIRADIAEAISKLDDEDEQTVLRKWYLTKRRPSWQKVGDEMFVSKRTAQRLHGRALLHFRIPPDRTAEDRKFLGL